MTTAHDIVAWLAARDGSLHRRPEIVSGDVGAPVDRLVLAWSATAAALAAAAAQPGRSLVIARTHPFYAPPAGFDRAIAPSRDGWQQLIAGDAVAVSKRAYADSHSLVLASAPWLWNLDRAAGRSVALARALGLGTIVAEAGAAVLVQLDAARTVANLAEHAITSLGGEHTLVVGDVDHVAHRAAVVAGIVTPSDLSAALEDGQVDVVIAGEAVEWEAVPYTQDVIDAGRRVSLIVVGNATSENPAAAALADALDRDGIPIPVVPISTPPAAWAVRKVVA